MCLIRSLREDRTVLACNQFVRKILGTDYVTPVTDKIENIYEETLPNKPVLYLLSAGADLTDNIDEFAKKKKQFPTNKVFLGEEQEKPAEHAIINAGFRDVRWLVLNNCTCPSTSWPRWRKSSIPRRWLSTRTSVSGLLARRTPS
jgi:dynein heavy chain